MILDRQALRRKKTAALRNRDALHPVMRKGGPHLKSNKAKRSSDKSALRNERY